ncbi:MAG: PTS sugar transporter subunit IIC [Gemmatimonadota bacterium]|nr:MAG: PTS sugar transporter subunit IIC [Gemmatimonadota bacterium]
MMENFGWLMLWGVLVGLDLVSALQTMIARPLIAGTVAGFILGDPVSGATVGVVLELFALEVLPVGGSRYPDYGLGAVCAAATAVHAPGVFGTGIGVAVGLFVAYIGGKAIYLVRVENAADVRAHRKQLDTGSSTAVTGVQLRSLGRDVVRALVVTWIGLLIAAATLRWLPVTLEVSVYLGIAAVGAGVAAGVSGVGRLTGRKSALSWFVLGLAGGLVGVVFG